MVTVTVIWSYDKNVLLITDICFKGGVLEKFDETSDNFSNGVLLLQRVPYYKLNCIELAAQADCKKFIAQTPVQCLLNDIWNGKIENKQGVKNQIKVKFKNKFTFKII